MTAKKIARPSRDKTQATQSLAAKKRKRRKKNEARSESESIPSSRFLQTRKVTLSLACSCAFCAFLRLNLRLLWLLQDGWFQWTGKECLISKPVVPLLDGPADPGGPHQVTIPKGAVFSHAPRVKSGTSIGMPPCATDCSLSALMLLHAAAS